MRDPVVLKALLCARDMVVGAVDVVADEPACGAADQDVRGEVLFGEDSTDADASGEAVDGGAGDPAGVLVAED